MDTGISNKDRAAIAKGLSRLLAELSVYVHKHFRTEEELMESCGYPGLENHPLQHAKFAARVEAEAPSELVIRKSTARAASSQHLASSTSCGTSTDAG